MYIYIYIYIYIHLALANFWCMSELTLAHTERRGLHRIDYLSIHLAPPLFCCIRELTLAHTEGRWGGRVYIVCTTCTSIYPSSPSFFNA